MKRNIVLLLPAAALIFLLSSCTAPRGIIASGKVTPKGTFKAGFNMGYNVSSAPLAEIDDITIAAVEDVDKSGDTIYYTETVQALTRGLLAYALDPVTATTDFYARYGLAHRMDVGYKYASGAHVFDAMYQFLGSTGTPDNPEPKKGMHGSVGVQFSFQNSNLPRKLGLDKLSDIFSFTLSRRDLLVPVAFSVPFGPEETYGNFSFGVVYGRSFIRYGFNPSKEVVRQVGSEVKKIASFYHKNDYSSYGAFLNAKIGYKYVYFVPAVSFYYQDYGTYDLFGFQQETYKGVTVIPSLGIQVNLGYNRRQKKMTDS